jgi:hypothetical protein
MPKKICDVFVFRGRFGIRYSFIAIVFALDRFVTILYKMTRMSFISLSLMKLLLFLLTILVLSHFDATEIG